VFGPALPAIDFATALRVRHFLLGIILNDAGSTKYIETERTLDGLPCARYL
jgi:hypothetical protein